MHRSGRQMLILLWRLAVPIECWLPFSWIYLAFLKLSKKECNFRSGPHLCSEWLMSNCTFDRLIWTLILKLTWSGNSVRVLLCNLWEIFVIFSRTVCIDMCVCVCVFICLYGFLNILAIKQIATALFANSPFTEGKPNGYLSMRRSGDGCFLPWPSLLSSSEVSLLNISLFFF